MITKGFLMFWGGIAGLAITLLLAVFMCVLSARKRKMSVEIAAAVENIQTKVTKTEKVSGIVPIKPIPDTAFIQTEGIIGNSGNQLPETKIMEGD